MLLYIIAAIFALALVTLLVWQGIHVVQVYKRSIGTGRQKFLAAFSDSLTILWARVVAFGGALLTFATTALPLLDPSSSTGQTIAGLFNADTLKYWLAGLTIIGLVFELMRRSPRSIDPVLPPPIGTGAPLAPLSPLAQSDAK